MMRISRSAVTVAASAALVVACGPGTQAHEQHGGQPSGERGVHTAIAELLHAPGGPPGVFVLVQNGRDRRTYARGDADLDTSASIRHHMHMRVASTAKAYSGAVALTLARRGVLRLDDRIGQRLPWAPRTWHRITLRQLLHHTSGLPDYSADPDFQAYLVDHLRSAPSPRRLLGFVTDERPHFTPGARYRYSNSDNVAAALMIEDATGRPYERVLARRVLRPLGLRDTSLPRGVRMPSPAVRGYQGADDGTLDDVTTLFAAGYAWASGGIISTPADQNRFIRGYVGRELFGRAMQGRRQFSFRRGTSQPPGPGRNAAGLAVFRYRTRCGTMYGHTGNTAGYTQFMAATEDGRRSVVVSINRQVTPDSDPRTFRRLRSVFRAAVCAAVHSPGEYP